MRQRDDSATDDREPHTLPARAHIFIVRVWREEVPGISEYRGSVRDVHDGAFRNFRDWRDLTAFMLARFDEADLPGSLEGDTR